MTAAPAAVRSTAAAAISLALAISGFWSGETTSAKNSRAVLNASAVQTAHIAATTQSHSKRDRWHRDPARITATVARACSHMFGCVQNNVVRPRNACRKLAARTLRLKKPFCIHPDSVNGAMFLISLFYHLSKALLGKHRLVCQDAEDWANDRRFVRRLERGRGQVVRGVRIVQSRMSSTRLFCKEGTFCRRGKPYVTHCLYDFRRRYRAGSCRSGTPGY
jgi:hypothetical protein